MAMMEQGNKSNVMSQDANKSMKRYYQSEEVAAYFAISRTTAYRLIDEECLKGTKIRNGMRVSVEGIRRYEESIEETTPF